MIRGVVNARPEAIVALRIRGPEGAELVVPTVVDSGYTGSLVLPDPTIAELGLIGQFSGVATLADGSTHRFPIYRADLLWDGQWRVVAVSALGDEALLGMSLLAGHDLRIEVIPGGMVQIVQLT